MSIYSGFATRQQEQTYDHCVNSLLYVLQKRISKFYTHQKTDQYKFATLVHKMFLQLKHMQKSKYLDPKCSGALTQLVDVLQKSNLSQHNATQEDNSNNNATIQQSQFSNENERQFRPNPNKHQSDQSIFERNYHPNENNRSGHLRQKKFHLPNSKVNHKQKPIFNVPILNNNNKNNQANTNINANTNNSHSNSTKKTNQILSNRKNSKQQKDKKKLSSKKQNQQNTSNEKVKLNLLSNYESAHVKRQKKQSSFSNNIINHKTLDHIVSQNNTLNLNNQAKVFAISQSRSKIQNLLKQQQNSGNKIGLQSNIRSRIASSSGQRQHIYNKKIDGQIGIFNTYGKDKDNHFERSNEKSRDQNHKILRSSSNSQNNYRNSYSSFNKKKVEKSNQKINQVDFLKEANFSQEQYELITKNQGQISEIIKDYVSRVKKGGPQKYNKTKDWALVNRFQDY